ncbi:MAG: S8 family serine peptidase [Candidatus Eisenbacteria bacterium]
MTFDNSRLVMASPSGLPPARFGWRRMTLALAVAAASQIPGLAAAAGSVQIGQNEYRQVDGAWQAVTPYGETFAVDTQVVTVRFVPGVSAAQQATLIQRNRTEVIRTNRLGFVDLRVAEGADVIEVVQSFLGSPLIQNAEPNTIGAYLATPNDPLYPSQWHLNQGNDADVDAPEAWDIEYGIPGVVVGVLDSGSDWTHNDLGKGTDNYSTIWTNPGEDAWTSPENPATGNGIDDDGNGHVDDWKGWDFTNDDNDARGIFDHGTRVAGIVAAKTNNGYGVCGVAGGFGPGGGFGGGKGARVMVVGVGDTAPVTSILDDAILYAIDQGARVITMSLTVNQTAAIDDALIEAWNAGLLIDCASGNSGGAVSYPARDANVIAVGATTQSDLIASFSSRGVDQELAAPGVNILSTVYNDGFQAGDGTSFAAPIVGGVSALLFSVNPGLTNVEARQILRDTADKVGPYNYNWNPSMPGHSQELGYGRVNAGAAVDAAQNTASVPGELGTLRLLTVGANTPNPFGPSTQIRYQLGAQQRVTIHVLDILGRRLATLADGMQAEGAHAVSWNGRDEAGRPAASGVYLYQVTAGDETSTGKMLLTR